MKRKLVLGCATFFLVVIGLIAFLIYYLFFSMGHLPEGKLITQSTSPNQTYTINVYEVNGGATTDFSIRGELVDNGKNRKKNIYWDYRTQNVNVSWISDNTVTINGHKLDVRRDTFDWRREKN